MPNMVRKEEKRRMQPTENEAGERERNTPYIPSYQ